MDKPEKVWCIVANSKGDKVYPTGAKLRVVGIGWEAKSLEVYGGSRGKRWVMKWVQIKTLKNFRPGWLPPKLRRECGMFMTKEEVVSDIEKGFPEERYAING